MFVKIVFGCSILHDEPSHYKHQKIAQKNIHEKLQIITITDTPPFFYIFANII